MAIDGFDSLAGLLEESSSTGPKQQILELPITEIMPDQHQVRPKDNEGFSDESLDALAATIRANGLFNPITVRPRNADGKYVIVMGERRFSAVCRLGWETIPCLIDAAEGQTDSDILIKQLVENQSRENLTLPEISAAIMRLLDSGMTVTQISASTGLKSYDISMYRSFALMPDYLKQLVKDGKLAASARTCFEMVQVYKEDPERCRQWIEETLKDHEPLVRSDAALFRKYLEKATNPEAEQAEDVQDESSWLSADDGEQSGGAESTSSEDAAAASENMNPEHEPEENEPDDTVQTEISAEDDDSSPFADDDDDAVEDEQPTVEDFNSDDDDDEADQEQDHVSTDAREEHDRIPDDSVKELDGAVEPSSAQIANVQEPCAEKVLGYWVRWQGQEVRMTLERSSDGLHAVLLSADGDRCECPLTEITLVREWNG